MVTKKKYLILLFLIIVIFVAMGIRDEKYKVYRFDCDPAKTFESDLQIIGINATGEKKKYNFLVYSKITRYKVNEIYFLIQGNNKPINKEVEMNISKVVLKNNEEEITNTTHSKVFIQKWSFDYTDKVRPDFVDPEVSITSTTHDSINNITIGRLRTENKNLGSYYYVFKFDKELTQTDSFDILIYYTSAYNTEEKVLEVNAEFSGFLEKRTYAYDREMARR